MNLLRVLHHHHVLLTMRRHHHHQGIKDLGQGLKIEAHSKEDDLVEAFRYEGDQFVRS